MAIIEGPQETIGGGAAQFGSSANTGARGGNRLIDLFSRLISPWQRGFRPSDKPAGPGKAVALYKPTRRDKIASGIAARNNSVPKYIEIFDEAFGYRILKRAPEINTTSDKVAAFNLMLDKTPEARELLDTLVEQSEAYFSAGFDLFQLHNRSDRNLWDLLRRPFTHADLEEENMEEKFPDDVESRSLVIALNRVLGKNQWLHILKKRERQLLATIPVAVLCLAWPHIDSYINGMLTTARMYGLPDAIPDEVSAIVLLLAAVSAYTRAAAFIMKRSLSEATAVFRAVNGTSCGVLSNHLTAARGKIRGTFQKLLKDDITISQNFLESVRERDWPLKAEKLFKLALWQGRRHEYLERFWQLQVERLRVFELVSDAIGNASSRLLAILMVTIPTATGYFAGSWSSFWYGTAVMSCLAIPAWYFSRLSRRKRFSFSMNDVVAEGFGKQWKPFTTAGYYKDIAEQYRSGKGAIQIQILNGLFPGGPPPR